MNLIKHLICTFGFILIGASSYSQYTTLLNFVGPNGGDSPGSLISDGTYLYGMTAAGGTNEMGTIFKILPDGTNYQLLLEFAGLSNGRLPFGSLISDGTFLYGMTEFGGQYNQGTIFKIMPDGSGFVKLFDFALGASGKNPRGSLY